MSQHIKDGGPAFPSDEKNADGSHYHGHMGMSLRDYFAAKALEGWIASWAGNAGDPFDPEHIGRAADRCYQMADAMLAAREKQS